MRTHRTLLSAALIALTAFAAGCTDQSTAVPAEPSLAISRFSRITVSPTSASLAGGASTQLTATAKDWMGRTVSGATFAWSSSNRSLATVSSTGKVTGVKAGVVSIYATRNGLRGTARITVTGTATPPVDTTPKPPADTTPTPTPTPPPVGTSGRWISAYYVGYQRNLYPETAIDFSLMTHIFVGAIQPTSTGGVTTNFYLDNVTGPAMAKTISSRAHAAGRKAILMLGGDGSRSTLLSATSAANMPTFVNNLLSTMTTLGYDGVDIDWEPIETADQPIVLDLAKRLRAARPSMVITVPVAWAPPASAWYASLASVVDQINIMSYSMAGNWGGWDSWHQGALYGETNTRPTSVSKAVKMYQAAGVPSAKIGIGLGFYGSCWRGPSTIGVPLTSGQDVVASDNTMSYTNIMNSYYAAANYKWDATARAGYLSFPTAKGAAGCNLVSYEDPQSIAEKGAYVKSAGLGGAIIWTINQAYFPSAASGSRDPLLKAAYNSIIP